MSGDAVVDANIIALDASALLAFLFRERQVMRWWRKSWSTSCISSAVTVGVEPSSPDGMTHALDMLRCIFELRPRWRWFSHAFSSIVDAALVAGGPLESHAHWGCLWDDRLPCAGSHVGFRPSRPQTAAWLSLDVELGASRAVRDGPARIQETVG